MPTTSQTRSHYRSIRRAARLMVARSWVATVSTRDLAETAYDLRSDRTIRVPWGQSSSARELARELRSEARATRTAGRSLHARLAAHWIAVPLGASDDTPAAEELRRLAPRKRRTAEPVARLERGGPRYTEIEDRSVPKSYLSKSWSYPTNGAVTVTSRARVHHGELIAEVWNWDRRRVERFRRRCPRGYVLGIDPEGIFLVRTRDGAEVHITADHIRAGLTAARTELLALARRRLARSAAPLTRAQLTRHRDLIVTVDDARRIGYCSAGIVSWCAQKGISHRRPISLRVLHRIGGGDQRITSLLRSVIARETA